MNDLPRFVDERIRDEDLRSRIKAMLPPGPPAPRWKAVLAHPLTGVGVGFLLTWLLGTLLTDQWRHAALVREAQLQAVSRFSHLAYDRRTYAELVLSAARRRAPETDVRRRKDGYDSAYVRWNREILATQLTARTIVGASEYSAIEATIQFGLTPRLVRLDQLVTLAYDSAVRGRIAPDSILAGGSEFLSAVLDCNYVVTQYLWASANAGSPPRNRWKSVVAQAESEMSIRCPHLPR